MSHEAQREMLISAQRYGSEVGHKNAVCRCCACGCCKSPQMMVCGQEEHVREGEDIHLIPTVSPLQCPGHH